MIHQLHHYRVTCDRCEAEWEVMATNWLDAAIRAWGRDVTVRDAVQDDHVCPNCRRLEATTNG